MLIHSTTLKTRKNKYMNLLPGSRKDFEKRYQLERGGTGLILSEAEIYLYDVLAGQDVEFEGVDEFIGELAILLRDWGGQKFFYEIPQKGINSDRTIKTLRDLAGQADDTHIRLYSARKATDVQNLFNWASTSNVAMTGFDGFAASASEDAPFKGHFGDRAHTVKHYNQKKGQGARLICLHLNASGSQEVRTVRNDPSFIAKGGEGSSAGGFGLKSENNYVSVALGKSRATWDHMKDKISRVELVK